MAARSAMPRQHGIATGRAALLAALLAVALLLSARAVSAREGIYAGLGIARQTVSDGIKGTEVYRNAPANTNEVRVGKPQPATGLAMNGGFGFNDYVALDFVVGASRHDTRHDPDGPSPQSFDATLNTVLFGLRLGAPLGNVAEVFGRAALGGYELQYRGSNFSGGKSVDDARLSGRGVAVGGGAEVFFGSWGLQLAYTLNDVDFTSLNSLNFGGELKPPLSPTITTVSLLLNVYLQ